MCLFSGIIDVERQNGIKKWLIYSLRERLTTDKLDEILQTFCDSPGLTDEDKNKWLVEVAKTWRSSANKQTECDELDATCNDVDRIDVLFAMSFIHELCFKPMFYITRVCKFMLTISHLARYSEIHSNYPVVAKLFCLAFNL